MTRILLFCPTHRLERETANAIHGMQHDGLALDTFFTADNPYGEMNGRNILHNYRKAERIIKAEGYDYLFTVENDIIPPPDALHKLLAVNADIAYGVYCFRRGKPLINIARNVNLESYSLPDHLKAWRDVFGQVVPCYGLGFGCTLIRQTVFDALELHSQTGHSSDTEVARDALRLGLTQKADTSVLCGHKRPDRVTIWPTIDGWREAGAAQPLEQRRIVPNQKIPYWDERDQVHTLQAGQMAEVDYENAGAFVSAGMAVYVDEMAAP